jgi:tRNA-Thr(GGU) m(6)t(6)A37 methyltransferase TsaA
MVRFEKRAAYHVGRTMPPKVLEVVPIGVIRTPFVEKVSAPRQTVLAREVPGRLELDPKGGFEHALSDLSGWEYLWVVYWFHRNEGWRPKVLPPRSERRRGVFATRSPHRPNPIGLSVVRLEQVEGLTVHVRGVDMLDGSPLLDIKPYVAYADALPGARAGWLDGERVPDPGAEYEVSWSRLAADQAAWLQAEHRVDLVAPVNAALRTGPAPHPYRRIREDGDALRLAVKDWRVRFRVEGKNVEVLSLHTGYRAKELADEGDPALAPHRAHVARFGFP